MAFVMGFQMNLFFAERIYQEIRDGAGEEKTMCISLIKPDVFARVNILKDAKKVSWIVDETNEKGAMLFTLMDTNYRINLYSK